MKKYRATMMTRHLGFLQLGQLREQGWGGEVGWEWIRWSDTGKVRPPQDP